MLDQVTILYPTIPYVSNTLTEIFQSLLELKKSNINLVVLILYILF